ncbi:MAG: hypothetical protein WC749_10530 [Dehalococcoidia bacterium]
MVKSYAEDLRSLLEEADLTESKSLPSLVYQAKRDKQKAGQTTI